MAASVLLIVGENQKLIERICEIAGAITCGQSKHGEMGPVIDQVSLEKVTRYIKEAEESGAKILLDGRSWSSDKKGYWIGPTVILHSNKHDAALLDEIFGPVLSIYACKTNDEAIEIENGNEYGNAACIYTSSGAYAEWFTKRFNAGMIGVNIGVPVPR